MSTVKPRQRRAQSNDARALRSRDALQDALLALVQEQPFEEVSIRDVTDRAGVSYPVFFRRYTTKEELLEDIATAEVRQLLLLALPIFAADNQTESLNALCGYIDERRRLWTRLLTGGAASAMRAEFRRIAQEIADSREQANPWLPRDLAVPFVVTGLFEILSWWLRQPADYPMENILKIIEALIIRTIVQPVDVQLL